MSKNQSYFYTEEQKNLLLKSINSAKNNSQKREVYEKLSKQFNRKVSAIKGTYYALKASGKSPKQVKTPLFTKGTVLNFPVSRAVIEEGKITLYFD